MTPTPLELYQQGLSATLAAPQGQATGAYRLRDEHGGERPLELARWTAEATAAEEALLDHVRGPVLDVGCGPGRHLVALGRRGIVALGLDVAPLAVRIARHRGAPAIHGSVFGSVPGRRAWATVLLLDGNLGIGGDPPALLRRISGLLAVGGCALVETGLPGQGREAVRARIEGPGGPSAWFPWAHVGPECLSAVAAEAGFAVDEQWSADGRFFARLNALAGDRRSPARHPDPAPAPARRAGPLRPSWPVARWDSSSA